MQAGLESNTPPSEVTLCGSWPVFAHVTVVPAGTEIDAGL
jgi:hypothetical protein